MARRWIPIGGLLLVVCAGAWLLWRDEPDGAGPSPEAPEPLEAAIARLNDAAPDHGFEPLAGAWRLALPADHGGHDEARMETWIVSAHLEDAEGRPLGVHFALSRYGIRRNARDAAASAWDLRAIHRGHVAVVAGGDAAASTQVRFSRGAVGSAGHDNERGEVWLDDWSLSFDPAEGDGPLRIEAEARGEPLRLVLTPVKPPLAAVGEAGAPLRGFSIPRLTVRGALGEGEARRDLSGTAWLDRAWGELPLPGAGPVTRDRLLLQLDDGADLSLLRTRRRDGRGAAALDGVLVEASGETRELSDAAVAMQPASEGTKVGGATFALDWTLRGPDLELRVSPVAEDQRLDVGEPGWLGLVQVEGRRNGVPVQGLGALQTTAMEDP